MNSYDLEKLKKKKKIEKVKVGRSWVSLEILAT